MRRLHFEAGALAGELGQKEKMFSFVVSKIFSPYYTSSKAFAYSLSRG